jgi:hypothetical protein
MGDLKQINFHQKMRTCNGNENIFENKYVLNIVASNVWSLELITLILMENLIYIMIIAN